MRIPFLRGERITLGPLPMGVAVDVDEGAIVLAAWVSDDAPLLGVAQLGPVDWVRRTAELRLWKGPGAEEALALILRYARDELALETLDIEGRGRLVLTS